MFCRRFMNADRKQKNAVRRGAALLLSAVFAVSVLLVPAASGAKAKAEDFTLAEAQAWVEAAQAELNAINALWDRGAYGFFEWVQYTYPEQAADAAAAIEALNQYKDEAPGIDPVVSGDATQITSMFDSLELLVRCNQLRQTDDNFPGLQPFGVTHTLMAMAMSNADLSVDPNKGHLGHFAVGENLAWNFGNPYNGWYDFEKKDYDNGKTSGIGHYLNIVSDGSNATGLGTNTRAYPGAEYDVYDSVHSQVFTTVDPATLISVDDYTKELSLYVQEIDPEPYEEALKTAEFIRDSLTPVAMYRLYYPDTHEHFYTADLNEKNTLTTPERGWVYEGIGWYAPKASGTPVYRLYNPFSTDHHYTKDYNEYVELGKVGWEQEGIGWYSEDPAKGVPLYRLFTEALEVGSHHYTKDLHERTELIKSGAWKDEDIGWYGMTEN